MYRPTTLLKVISILFIIGGVFGIISALGINTLIEMSEQMAGGATVFPKLTTLDIVISIVISVSQMAAAILALMGKKYKVVMILVIVSILFTTYSIISSIYMYGFTALSFSSYLLPALFVWGLIQSKGTETEA